MRRTSVEPIRKLYNDPYVLYIGIFSFLHSFTTYIGGNQREKDRERAAKKAAANAKKAKGKRLKPGRTQGSVRRFPRLV